jgi:hypothetical protein
MPLAVVAKHVPVVVQFEIHRVVIGSGLWETVGMPKDRKKTYSDHQSEASRAKKQPRKKKKTSPEDLNQAAARVVKELTEGR